MKTFRCVDLGGPCSQKLSGDTPEELMNAAAVHLHAVVAAGDEAHRPALDMMMKMQGTLEGEEWNKRFMEQWQSKKDDN